MATSWSNLRDDILDLIIHKVDLIAFIRLSAVCRSWRNSSETHRRICIDKSPKTIPWLIFKESPKFYSFSDRKTYNYPLDFPPFYLCFGSSNGFLLTTDPKISNLYVINPCTGVYFSFPTPLSLRYRLFHRAVMIVSPYNASSDPKQRVMVASLSSIDRYFKTEIPFLNFDGTSSCDETSWTSLGVYRTESTPPDIIFHRERLYATKFSDKTSFFDLNSLPAAKQNVISDIPLRTVLTDRRYFVESPNGDQLFMVVKKIKTATSFTVFEYDESRKEWIEVKSLGNIALFVGCNSVSIFPELYCDSVVAKNCIYYFDLTEQGDDRDALLKLNRAENFDYGISFTFGEEQKREISGDVFEFRMEDGNIKRLNAVVQMSRWASPLWFLPSL